MGIKEIPEETKEENCIESKLEETKNEDIDKDEEGSEKDTSDIENVVIQQRYCVCNLPYDETRPMIRCDKCKDWYHGECTTFKCDKCKTKEKQKADEEMKKMKD